jgi:hypothetical protein
MNAELAARRTAAAAVLADYRAAAASAPLSRPPGPEWTLRLASMLDLLLDALSGAEDEDGLEPYCAECGHWIGLFPAAGGWKHYRGDPRGGKRELYDAGHDPAPAWTEPPGRVLSPADVAVAARALEEAAAYRRDRVIAWCYDCTCAAAGACEAHLDDLDQADAYDQVAGMLTETEDR